MKIELYSLGTPNGKKISIALEEMGIDYNLHIINIAKGDQFTDEFKAINPNSKIPAIVDPAGGKDNTPLPIMESGAILIYLAQKSGKFLPEHKIKYIQTIQWLMWQMGGLGPMFGQLGHFYVYGPKDRDLSYGQERYLKEAIRLLHVLDNQLKNNDFMIGKDLTIADFATLPWVLTLDENYQSAELLNLNSFLNINRWKNNLLNRPGVKKGLEIYKH